MIRRPLQPAEAFYRFNTPRWSYRPTSGAGAAKVGGRFNRPGVEALYLSRSVETASAEYQQDEPLMPPGTLVTYRIALSQVVDFQKGYVRSSAVRKASYFHRRATLAEATSWSSHSNSTTATNCRPTIRTVTYPEIKIRGAIRPDRRNKSA